MDARKVIVFAKGSLSGSEKQGVGKGHSILASSRSQCGLTLTNIHLDYLSKQAYREEIALLLEHTPRLPDLPSQLLTGWSQCQLKYCICLGEAEPHAQNRSQIIPQILLIQITSKKYIMFSGEELLNY